MTEAKAIRVLLVDDNATLRESLRSALQAHSNIEVVGEANDGEEALARVENLQPTVVVMDVNMPRMDGVTATRLIKEQCPEVAVIGLSVEQKDYELYAMQKAGALEILAKKNAGAELYDAIQRAVAFVQPAVRSKALPVSKPGLEGFDPFGKELMKKTDELLRLLSPADRPLIGQEEPPSS